ncbi:unnamed protein product [Phytomonas sp. Hart1]|nr:unnamed protein product [Phytomonas sp. Hart1]|eukprot:CCW70715.1 unnamed protein product [Phytomonas sp. isolate Hart1]
MKHSLSKKKGECGLEEDTTGLGSVKSPFQTSLERHTLAAPHEELQPFQEDSSEYDTNIITSQQRLTRGSSSTHGAVLKTEEKDQATRQRRTPKLYFFHQSDILSLVQPATSSVREQSSRENGGVVLSATKEKSNVASAQHYCISKPYSGGVHPRLHPKDKFRKDSTTVPTLDVAPHGRFPLKASSEESTFFPKNPNKKQPSPTGTHGGSRLVTDPVFSQMLSMLSKSRKRALRCQFRGLTEVYGAPGHNAETVAHPQQIGPSRRAVSSSVLASDNVSIASEAEGPPPSSTSSTFHYPGLPQFIPQTCARSRRRTLQGFGPSTRKSRTGAVSDSAIAPLPPFEAHRGTLLRTPRLRSPKGGAYRRFSSNKAREFATSPWPPTEAPCLTVTSPPRALRGASRDTRTTAAVRKPSLVQGPSQRWKGGARLGESAWDPSEGSSTTPAVAVAEEEGDDPESTSIMVDFMPKGRYIIMNFLSNWGDDYEIGISGVEFFNEHGQSVIPDETTGSSSLNVHPRSVISADDSAATQEGLSASVIHPHQTMDIDSRQVVSLMHTTRDGLLKVLAEYSSTGEEFIAMSSASSIEEFCSNSRRQLCNIIHGPYNTHDENGMFAIPYTHSHNHLICFMFSTPITLSMIRIYNYSGKGRVHTTKGVRVAEITVDDILVFHGEIAQSSGEWITDPLQRGIKNCENILFTQDLCILRRILGLGHKADDSVNCAYRDEYENSISRDFDEGGWRRTSSQSSTGHGERPQTSSNHTTRGTTFLFYSDSDQAQNYVGGRLPVTTLSSQLSVGHSTAGTLSSSLTNKLRARPSTTSMVQKDQSSSQVTDQCTSITPPTVSLSKSLSESTKMTKTPPMKPSLVNTSSSNDNAWVGAIGAEGNGDHSQFVCNASQHYTSAYPSECPKQVRSACFMLLSTWGDTEHIGLSGLRLRDAHGNCISASLRSASVQYPDGSYMTLEKQRSFQNQVRHLFDECPDTACVLPFFPGMELLLIFDKPIETLGFLDIANYSVGTHTYCGVKEVRLFLSVGSSSSFSTAEHGLSEPPQPLIYQHLWTLASSRRSRRVLQQAGVLEITPSEGVVLRKAPVNFNRARFQTYDLSLGNSNGDEIEITEWGDDGSSRVEQMDRFYIAVGPGTGGDSAPTPIGLSKDEGGAKMRCIPTLSGTGCTREGSLSASMNIRAMMAMRRARMLLRDWPDWLLDYQPYITPLLPVGYVLKVCLTICARSVGASASSREATAGPPSLSSGEAAGSPFPAAADSLKAYLKEWILSPLASCSIVNEDGKIIQVPQRGQEGVRSEQNPDGMRLTEEDSHVLNFLRNHTETAPLSDEDAGGDGYFTMNMVAESLVSTSPTLLWHPSPEAASTQLQVYVELAYVSDTPFCLSVLGLNRPLVLDGAAAWVKNILVRMDDTLIYDSGDAVLKLAHSSLSTRPIQQSSVDSNPPLPPCVSSLKPIILFSLDTKILDSLSQNVIARQKTRVSS